MSENRREAVHSGVYGSGSRPGELKKRAACLRDIAYALTIHNNSAVRDRVPNSAVANCLAVACVELSNMARGKAKADGTGSSTTLPRFVDVPIGADDRRAFLEWIPEAGDLVLMLSALCDCGYRVGCSWSGEHQTYTVSLTCRNPEDVNNGLCMTSFAKALDKAIALALYKHQELTRGHWLGEGSAGSEDFG